VVLEYKLGVKYVQYPDYKMPMMGSKPTLMAQFTKGISGALGSNVDYDKWSVGIKDESNQQMTKLLRSTNNKQTQTERVRHKATVKELVGTARGAVGCGKTPNRLYPK
jgi:hypothetical protein